MSGGALRAAGVVFVLGLLFVWLIRPIGSACPDVDKLPRGSAGSSAPSFAPPLTRMCTYTTADGTKARKRYVPVIDVLVLALVAGIVGGAIALAGPGRPPRPPREREPAPERDRERERTEREARRRG